MFIIDFCKLILHPPTLLKLIRFRNFVLESLGFLYIGMFHLIIEKISLLNNLYPLFIYLLLYLLIAIGNSSIILHKDREIDTFVFFLIIEKLSLAFSLLV